VPLLYCQTRSPRVDHASARPASPHHALWPRLSAGFRIGLAIVAVLTLSTSRLALGAATKRVPEYTLKALCLFNFGKLIGWPSDAPANAEATFRIGVLGPSSSGELMLDQLRQLRNKAVNGRPVDIVKLTPGDDPSRVHILYVPSELSGQWSELIPRLRDKAVLTVGDRVPRFPESQVMFHLVIDAEALSFEINLEAARLFTISPNLSELGRVVKPDRKQP
jgi:YfiR/HmsC-like